MGQARTPTTCPPGPWTRQYLRFVTRLASAASRARLVSTNVHAASSSDGHVTSTPRDDAIAQSQFGE